jgi:protein O-GlcNAc transferase
VTGRDLDEAWRLHRAGAFEQAEHLYRDLIRIDPSHYLALHRLGFLYGQCGRWDEAQAMMARAIAVNPHASDALFLRGSALQKLDRHDDAVACFDRALAIAPGLAEVRLNRAASLYRLRRYEEAAEDYSRLLDANPDYPFARGNRLFCRMQLCEWSSLAEDTAAIATALRTGRRVIAPFDAKALFLTAADHLACAQIWAADQHASPAMPLRQHPARHARIRVAYVSADFRAGPLATLMTGVFERHDRTRIETIGVSLGRDDGSAARARLKGAFGRFVDAAGMSDTDIVALLREAEIDIAVDLMGFTEGARPDIFRHRAAPIQVNHLGFPGTVGAPWLDYLIADRIVVPDEQRGFFAEQIAYLPGSYFTRDTAVQPGPSAITRAEERLPDDGFVFACFNNSYKINPAMFDIWMRLLLAIEGSVLWLPESRRTAVQNLAREAQARGVSPERLVFASFRQSPKEHLTRLKLADLFLDTLPYNAHTTASDALWAGLPVLTCRGDSFAGRVAASLLSTLGVPELVTDTLAAYEREAFRLARNPDELAAIRDKLERHRAGYPLFDEQRFARDLETAYATMFERCRRGEPPRSFAVPS